MCLERRPDHKWWHWSGHTSCTECPWLCDMAVALAVISTLQLARHLRPFKILLVPGCWKNISFSATTPIITLILCIRNTLRHPLMVSYIEQSITTVKERQNTVNKYLDNFTVSSYRNGKKNGYRTHYRTIQTVFHFVRAPTYYSNFLCIFLIVTSRN